jgi:hypothetical protein
MLTALVEFTGVFYMTITLTLLVSALKRHRAARRLEKRRAAQRQAKRETHRQYPARNCVSDTRRCRIRADLQQPDPARGMRCVSNSRRKFTAQQDTIES